MKTKNAIKTLLIASSMFASFNASAAGLREAYFVPILNFFSGTSELLGYGVGFVGFILCCIALFIYKKESAKEANQREWKAFVSTVVTAVLCLTIGTFASGIVEEFSTETVDVEELRSGKQW